VVLSVRGNDDDFEPSQIELEQPEPEAQSELMKQMLEGFNENWFFVQQKIGKILPKKLKRTALKGLEKVEDYFVKVECILLSKSI
jgi:hypothetical protein